jgi:hypothetical protein
MNQRRPINLLLSLDQLLSHLHPHRWTANAHGKAIDRILLRP